MIPLLAGHDPQLIQRRRMIRLMTDELAENRKRLHWRRPAWSSWSAIWKACSRVSVGMMGLIRTAGTDPSSRRF